MEVTIQANAPVLGMRPWYAGGKPERVELTPFIERVAAGGKITILERHCPAVEAILTDGEYPSPGEPAVSDELAVSVAPDPVSDVEPEPGLAGEAEAATPTPPPSPGRQPPAPRRRRAE